MEASNNRKTGLFMTVRPCWPVFSSPISKQFPCLILKSHSCPEERNCPSSLPCRGALSQLWVSSRKILHRAMAVVALEVPQRKVGTSVWVLAGEGCFA